MKHIEFTPSPMVCTKKINFDLDENNKIHNLTFMGGCNGNLKAIAKLCEGQDAESIKNILAGNTCGMRPTSCADQLSKALLEALNA
jgi:uncharacterized protein (TIGR03905 family)